MISGVYLALATMFLSASMSLSQRHAQTVGEKVVSGRASLKAWRSSLRPGSLNSVSGPPEDAIMVFQFVYSNPKV